MLVKQAAEVFLLLTSYLTTASETFCKILPSDPEWPIKEGWQELNTSVSGRLSASEPPGAVCHPGQDVYDKAFCTYVQRQWVNSSWHASNPWSADYNDNTCPPDPSQPCSDKGYPAYAVEAETVADVQEAVKFALRTGVRLIVKGTGHDFLGRSSGGDSLSIWTHKLRGVQVDRDNRQAIKYGGVAAVKIGAGMRWGEVYEEMVTEGLTVVGGSNIDVGVGGLLTGGGHSPISAHYGFPADHVLEMEVVTADGKHRVINAETDSDLFWAMRGGGGSTFAVLVSVTIKAYPQLPGTQALLMLNTTANSDTFWSLAAYFNAQIPRISEASGMGYYFITPNAAMGPAPGDALPGRDGSVLALFRFPERTPEEVNEVMGSLGSKANSSDWATDPIYETQFHQEFSDVMALILEGETEAAGSNTRLGSWLLDEQGLSGDIDKRAAQLRSMSQSFPLLGHLVSGSAVRKTDIPGGGNSILPAWRTALSHFVLPRLWPSGDLVTKALVVRGLQDKAIPTLKELSPKSGAYMNEADPANPDWQADYFGENYPKLLKLKRKWDPEGVFWCKPCVGNELWEVRDGPAEENPAEWGVGQVGGRICEKGKWS